MAAGSDGRAESSTLDLVKLAAVVAMIVDHIGLYFLPEQPLLRVIGRPAAVIFGFLIGYSGATRVPASWIGLGLGLTFLERALDEPEGSGREEHDASGDEPEALDILIGLALTRIAMPFFAWLHGIRAWLLVPAAMALGLLAPVTNHYFEYGSEVAVVALVGLARRLGGDTIMDRLTCAGVALVALVTVATAAVTYFNFTGGYAIAAVAVIAVTIIVLMGFVRRPIVGLPAALARPLCWVGRTTLWIYAAHVAAFQLIAHALL